MFKKEENNLFYFGEGADGKRWYNFGSLDQLVSNQAGFDEKPACDVYAALDVSRHGDLFYWQSVLDEQ